MASIPKQLTKEELYEGTLGFTMALRESLMSYYKGTCVEGFNRLSAFNVGIDNVRLQVDPSQSRAFNYQRRDHEMREPKMYSLLGSGMFEVYKHDPEVVFHPTVMGRSPELRMVRTQLGEFFSKYLPDVKIVERDTKASKRQSDGSCDRDMIVRFFDEDEQYKNIGKKKKDVPAPGIEPVRMDWRIDASPFVTMSNEEMMAAHRMLMEREAARRRQVIDNIDNTPFEGGE